MHKGEGVREFDQGKNKGFAFIEYETEEAAQNALKNYQDPSGQIKIIPKYFFCFCLPNIIRFPLIFNLKIIIITTSFFITFITTFITLKTL